MSTVILVSLKPCSTHFFSLASYQFYLQFQCSRNLCLGLLSKIELIVLDREHRFMAYEWYTDVGFGAANSCAMYCMILGLMFLTNLPPPPSPFPTPPPAIHGQPVLKYAPRLRNNQVDNYSFSQHGLCMSRHYCGLVELGCKGSYEMFNSRNVRRRWSFLSTGRDCYKHFHPDFFFFFYHRC